jgi:hypothetical protein
MSLVYKIIDPAKGMLETGSISPVKKNVLCPENDIYFANRQGYFVRRGYYDSNGMFKLMNSQRIAKSVYENQVIDKKIERKEGIPNNIDLKKNEKGFVTNLLSKGYKPLGENCIINSKFTRSPKFKRDIGDDTLKSLAIRCKLKPDYSNYLFMYDTICSVYQRMYQHKWFLNKYRCVLRQNFEEYLRTGYIVDNRSQKVNYKKFDLDKPKIFRKCLPVITDGRWRKNIGLYKATPCIEGEGHMFGGFMKSSLEEFLSDSNNIKLLADGALKVAGEAVNIRLSEVGKVLGEAWDKIKQFFSSLYQYIEECVEALFNKAKELYEWTKEKIGMFIVMMVGLLEKIAQELGENFNKFGHLLRIWLNVDMEDESDSDDFLSYKKYVRDIEYIFEERSEEHVNGEGHVVCSEEGLLASLIVALVASFAPDQTPEVRRFLTSIERKSQHIGDHIVVFFKKVMYWITGDRSWVMKDFDIEAEKYIAIIDQYLVNNKFRMMYVGSASFRKSLEDQLSCMFEFTRSHDIKGHESTALKALKFKINDLRKLMGALKPPKPPKSKEAMFYYIYSADSGTGKDTLLTYIKKAVFRHQVRTGRIEANMDYDEELVCWSKPKESEYDDGYAGQPIFYCSDAFADKDTAKTAPQMSILLDMISTGTMHMNMSGVEDKGTTTFTSPLVVYTSNRDLKEFEHLGLANYHAVYDRITLPIKLHRGEGLPEDMFSGQTLSDWSVFDKLWKIEIMPIPTIAGKKNTRNRCPFKPGTVLKVSEFIRFTLSNLYLSDHNKTLNDIILNDMNIDNMIDTLMDYDNNLKEVPCESFELPYDSLSSSFYSSIDTSSEEESFDISKDKGKEKAPHVNEGEGHMMEEIYRFVNGIEFPGETADHKFKKGHEGIYSPVEVKCLPEDNLMNVGTMTCNLDNEIPQWTLERRIYFTAALMQSTIRSRTYKNKLVSMSCLFIAGNTNICTLLVRRRDNGTYFYFLHSDYKDEIDLSFWNIAFERVSFDRISLCNTQYKDFMEYFRDCTNYSWKFTHPNRLAKASMIASAAVSVTAFIVGCIIGTIATIVNLAMPEDTQGEPQEGDSHSASKIRQVQKNRTFRRVTKKEFTKPTVVNVSVDAHSDFHLGNGDSSVNENKGIVQSVLSNCVRLIFKNNRTMDTFEVFGTMISKRGLVTVRHAAISTTWDELVVVPLCTGTKNENRGSVSFAAEYVNISVIDGSELCILQLDHQMVSFRDIRHHMVNSITDPFKMSKFLLYTARGHSDDNYQLYSEYGTKSFKMNIPVKLGRTDWLTEAQYYFAVDIAGTWGDCGLPVFGINENGKVKISGFYFGKDKQSLNGLVGIMTSDMFDIAQKSVIHRVADGHLLKDHDFPEYVKPTIMSQPPNRNLQGCNPVAKLNTFYKGTGETDYVVSPFKKAWNDRGYNPGFESGMCPVVRDERYFVGEDEKGNPIKLTVSSWWKANENMCKTSTPVLPKDFVRIVYNKPSVLWIHSISKLINRRGRRCKFKTLREFLLGSEYSSGQKRGTSVGYYGKAKPHLNDRFVIFNHETQEIEKEFEGDFDEIIRRLENGEEISFINIQSLKDELLPRKVVEEEMKARMFAVADMMQMCVLGTTVGEALEIIKQDVFSPYALGINFHTVDAKLVADEMYKFANHRKGAGDIKAMDASIATIFGYLLFRLFNDEFYHFDLKSKEANRLHGACMSLFNYYWMRTCGLYKQFKGQGSGNWLTSFLNCFVMDILHSWAFMKLYPDLYNNMPDYLGRKFHGDDSAWSASDAIPEFTMKNLQKIFLEDFGVIYTDPNKNMVCPDYVEEKDYTFLGRTLEKFNGSWIGRLQERSILGMIEWIKKDTIPREQMYQNCQAALREYLFYGHEIYNQRREEFLKAFEMMDEYGISLPTYDESYMRWTKEYSRDSRMLTSYDVDYIPFEMFDY